MTCGCKLSCCSATSDHYIGAPREVQAAVWAVFTASTRSEDPFWSAALMYDSFRKSSSMLNAVPLPESDHV